MNQMHLVVYLEYEGCEEVKVDKAGWILMRRKDDYSVFTAVPVPSNGDKLKDSTIYSICKALRVPLPPTAPNEIQVIMERIHEDVQKRIGLAE